MSAGERLTVTAFFTRTVPLRAFGVFPNRLVAERSLVFRPTASYTTLWPVVPRRSNPPPRADMVTPNIPPLLSPYATKAPPAIADATRSGLLTFLRGVTVSSVSLCSISSSFICFLINGLVGLQFIIPLGGLVYKRRHHGRRHSRRTFQPGMRRFVSVARSGQEIIDNFECHGRCFRKQGVKADR